MKRLLKQALAGLFLGTLGWALIVGSPLRGDILRFPRTGPSAQAQLRRPINYSASASAVIDDLSQFVAADTTNPPGNEAKVVKLVAVRLDKAGIAYEITEFAPGRQNIVARVKGQEPLRGKPILLLAHSDVVGTSDQAWTTKPHEVTKKDQYLIGRGVSDDLGMAAVNLEVFILLKNQILHRDVIFALTGDEENNGAGIQYLLKNKPSSIDAEIAFNEGGGLVLNEDGSMKSLTLNSAEKTYQDFELLARSEPGHSSMPLKDNSIYRLSRALARLDAHHEPARMTAITRAYYLGRAALEKPPVSDAMLALAHSKGSKLPSGALAILETNPEYSSDLRTTCVATTLSGGSRVNALPAQALANINCRIMPDESIALVRKKLTTVINDPKIEIRLPTDSGISGPSPVDGEGPKAVTRIAHEMWPGLPILPFMDRGASDSRFLRQKGVAAYGLSPLPAYESDDYHVHGVDERVPEASIRKGVEFFYRLMMDIAG